MSTTYQIIARGDYKGWHKSLEKAVQHLAKLTGYESGEIQIFEVPKGAEMEIDEYECVRKI